MAEILAAGGIVLRGEPGAREVALVHRPKYDDWTLPKGKLDAGEGFEDAALREVGEETGLRCRLGPFAGERSYTDSRGRPKLVRYWTMSVEEGEFAPNKEVDELRWLSLEEAVQALSYPGDQELLTDLSD